MKRALALAAVGLAAVLALGVGLSSGGTAAKPVTAKLVEFKIILSTKTVRAGQVTFVVRNAGRIPHELIVIKTSRRAGELLDDESRLANQTGDVGEVAPLLPRRTKKLTLKLTAGHYVLLCNIPGHYLAGQSTNFVVR